jgi:AcrR family transcriptional regulator
MDNQTRSEISRRRAIDAALAILGRDGVGGLTFDALARESGISKGGLLHQFQNKQGILRAVLERQQEWLMGVAKNYLANEGATKREPHLAAQIAVYRESVSQPDTVARAGLSVLLDTPSMRDDFIEANTALMNSLRAESQDMDLSLLRYFAASGLALHSVLQTPQLDEATRSRLFERLLDEDRWTSTESETAPRRK